MKKIILSLYCSIFLFACGEKQENKSEQTTQLPEVKTFSSDETQKTFSYQKDNLSSHCQSDDELICAIEKTVKCALNPTQSYCDKKEMPDFIFYDDAMFADDNGLGRPTTQSFQLVKIKPINQTTYEVLTKGECDKNWFGNCAGNIIYVMNNKTGKWTVQEIYAIETIR